MDLQRESVWGVYQVNCVRCNHLIIIVATVHSVDYGYAEAFEDDAPLCLGCRACDALGPN